MLDLDQTVYPDIRVVTIFITAEKHGIFCEAQEWVSCVFLLHYGRDIQSILSIASMTVDSEFSSFPLSPNPLPYIFGSSFLLLFLRSNLCCSISHLFVCVCVFCVVPCLIVALPTPLPSLDFIPFLYVLAEVMS